MCNGCGQGGGRALRARHRGHDAFRFALLPLADRTDGDDCCHALLHQHPTTGIEGRADAPPMRCTRRRTNGARRKCWRTAAGRLCSGTQHSDTAHFQFAPHRHCTAILQRIISQRSQRADATAGSTDRSERMHADGGRCIICGRTAPCSGHHSAVTGLADAGRSPSAFLCCHSRGHFWWHDRWRDHSRSPLLDTAAMATVSPPATTIVAVADPSLSIAARLFFIFFRCASLRVQAAAADAEKKSNPMRNIRIEKLVINCCVGESGDRLTRAAKVNTSSQAGRLVRARMHGARCSTDAHALLSASIATVRLRALRCWWSIGSAAVTARCSSPPRAFRPVPPSIRWCDSASVGAAGAD